jgi:hypothetical protein
MLGQNGPNPQTYSTLTAWQNGTGYDLNSLAGAPTFVNRNARDYHLAPGPLGIGTGRNGENMGAYRTGTEVIGPGNLPPTLEFSAATYSIDESGGSATITVSRSGSGTEAVTVNCATGNGSALAGADYTTAAGTLSWAAGDTSPKIFTVAITNDTDVEGSETVDLTLSNPGGATLGLSNATLTISDDDAAVPPPPSPAPSPPPTVSNARTGGGCTLGTGAAPDPTLPLLLGVALVWLGAQRRPARAGRRRVTSPV